MELQTNIFYVYVHRRKDNNVPFYVGKGKCKRAWFSKGRSQLWKNIVSKHDIIIEIIKESLFEKQAFDLEAEMIFTLKTRDYFGGANMTDGGDGTSGWNPSKSTRLKMSESNKKRKGEKRRPWTEERHEKCDHSGKNNPMSGKKHTKTSIEKMKNSQFGKKNGKCSDERARKISESNKGKKRTPEQIENIRKGALKRDPKTRIVSEETKLKLSLIKSLFYKNKRKQLEDDIKNEEK